MTTNYCCCVLGVCVGEWGGGGGGDHYLCEVLGLCCVCVWGGGAIASAVKCGEWSVAYPSEELQGWLLIRRNIEIILHHTTEVTLRLLHTTRQR